MTNKPYDRNDNDTYVERYSSVMATDVEVHMFQNPNAGVVYVGGVRGDFSTESAIRAKNNVLKFPTSTLTGLIKIKEIDLNTLLPMSLVQRYERTEAQMDHPHKTPIFYDTKLNKFVVLMDYRFLRDIRVDELGLPGERDKKIHKIYIDKKDDTKSYLGILFDSVSDIEKYCNPATVADSTSNPYNIALEAYQLYKMSLQGGEKVIVVKYRALERDRTDLFPRSVHKAKESIVAKTFDFEYAVAVRFGKRYYLCDEQGKIIQSTTFLMDKAKEQGAPSTEQDFFGGRVSNKEDHSDVFVTAYSDAQLKLVAALSERMHAVHTELCELFRSATNKDNGLDSPVLSLPDSGYLKLIGSDK
jgi:hypothetical protein